MENKNIGVLAAALALVATAGVVATKSYKNYKETKSELDENDENVDVDSLFGEEKTESNENIEVDVDSLFDEEKEDTESNVANLDNVTDIFDLARKLQENQVEKTCNEDSLEIKDELDTSKEVVVEVEGGDTDIKENIVVEITNDNVDTKEDLDVEAKIEITDPEKDEFWEFPDDFDKNEENQK